MHEWTGNDLTGKKLSPGILAICAHNRLTQAIDVASCCHPYHAFLPAFRTFNCQFYDLCRPVLHKTPPINAAASTAFCLEPKRTLRMPGGFSYRGIRVFLLIAQVVTNAEGAPLSGFLRVVLYVKSRKSKPRSTFFHCGGPDTSIPISGMPRFSSDTREPSRSLPLL
jgi:hypothetical protein